jgi:hypothetical protein
MQDAHNAGLADIPYSFLTDAATYDTADNLGVDGVLTNFPEVVASVRDDVFGPVTLVPEPCPLASIGLGCLAIAAMTRQAVFTRT